VGRFLTVAEWHSTFPVQTLAGQGYATLMVNDSDGGEHGAGSPVKAREKEGWNTLSTFESAVQMMVQRGIADPDKLGLYGWSHGASVVEFLVAHSKLHFTAACLGEGGGYGPGLYWSAGHPGGPKLLQTFYGGPLTAQTAAAYLEYSPALNVEKIKTPLLMEYQSVWRMTVAGELYVPLRVLGVPAELVGYENEVHNFVRPTTRFASMHRKVDWFNYWMLEKEDPDPAKAEQYVRWRKMKADWEATRAPAPNGGLSAGS
jgi:dipeptidyl aminopeptidase/acylaminoacyl peptidase